MFCQRKIFLKQIHHNVFEVFYCYVLFPKKFWGYKEYEINNV